MPRTAFDTNVYISALTHQGLAARLLLMASEGAFSLQISDAIVEEIVEVLERNFLWPQEKLQTVRPLLLSIAQHVTPHLELSVVERDPDNGRILECSQASRSDYIVTSDKHLLDLKQYAGARVIQPMEFLALLQSGGAIKEP